jgi:hypothetical protein
MTSFNRTESARFAQENQKIVGELHAGVDKALAEAASRGFPAAPGDTLATILAAGQAAKDKLTEFNGTKIYDDRRKVLFEQDEFAMKMIVSLAALGMKLYAAELINALVLENAENTALRDIGLADVIRMTAVVESRQAAIIQNRAEAERQVIVYKVLLASAELATLTSEIALVNAQLATAIAKLEIIGTIYEIVAAEELVLAAERAKQAALLNVLAAKQALAAAKRELVAVHLEKAAAHETLAVAITDEVGVKMQVEALGYDRAALRVAEGEAEHGVRSAELALEAARATLARASGATEIARAQSQSIIAAASNAAQASINASKSAAGMTNVNTRMATSLGHATIESNQGVAIAAFETSTVATELAAVLQGLAARAQAQANAINASKENTTINDSTTLLSRKIVHGAF